MVERIVFQQRKMSEVFLVEISDKGSSCFGAIIYFEVQYQFEANFWHSANDFPNGGLVSCGSAKRYFGNDGLVISGTWQAWANRNL